MPSFPCPRCGKPVLQGRPVCRWCKSAISDKAPGPPRAPAPVPSGPLVDDLRAEWEELKAWEGGSFTPSPAVSKATWISLFLAPLLFALTMTSPKTMIQVRVPGFLGAAVSLICLVAFSVEWNQSLNTYLGWTAFKMWNGALVDGDKAYYMGPYDAAVPGNDPAATAVQKGLRLGCLRYADENRHPLDGGYTGPGRDESAVMISRPFDYARSSAVAGSWKEADNTYRNKAMMVQGDGVWAAWKPSPAGTVELVRATPTVNQAYSLSVGAGMRGQDIWPNLAFAAGRYVVYALFNARPSAGVAPVGPSTLTVFDTATGTEKWTAALTDPTLRPNSHELYFEIARLAVAGNHAYVAWVDAQTGPNLKLQVAGVDVTAAAPPASIVPFTVDLGVPLGENLESRVTDLIAVDGTLLALVSESPDLLRNGHIHAQQVVALSSSGGGGPPPPPPPPTTGQGKSGGGGCGLLGIDLAWIALVLRRCRAARP